MKHAALAVLCLGLLVGCQGNNDAALPPTSPTIPEATLPVGAALSAVYTQAFDGMWNITDLPKWVTASPSSGRGNISTTLTVNRALALNGVGAQAPAQLSGSFKVAWQRETQGSPAAGTPASGSATVNISADLYQLSGQVSLAASGADVAPAQPWSVPGHPAASASQRVVVRYKTPAALQASRLALSSGNLSALSLPAQAQARAANWQLRAEAADTLTLSTNNLPATLDTLQADPNVLYAVPDGQLHALALPQAAPYLPSDQYAPLQYAYRLLGYGAVWRDMKTAPYPNAVTVAVIDSGVRYDHPDLAGKLWNSGEGALDVVTTDPHGPDTDPTDPGPATLGASNNGSHGTHVTGIIVAGEGPFTAPCEACSTSGVVGATLSAPVKVLPIRVIDNAGNISASDVALSIRYAAGETVTVAGVKYSNPHPAKVINLSLGGDISAATAQPMCEAVSAATQQGALVVVAAGNKGQSAPYYPAACQGAVSVAAVRPDVAGVPVYAEYSQHYPQVQLAAYGGSDPGVNPTHNMQLVLNGQAAPDEVLSTSWDYAKNQPKYQFESGTSQAAPQVSALAALLLSKGVAATAQAALARLQLTATDIGPTGRDEYTGYGVINAAAALNAPAVSQTLTLSVLGNAKSVLVPLNAAGAFNTYLPDGDFQLLAGYDTSAAGWGSTPVGAKASVLLGPQQPSAKVALTVKP